MSRLIAEHQRLFAASPGGSLPTAFDAHVRALVLALHSPADWATLAPLWRGVQADFDWPEPAIAVNGRDAFELWFSLAEPLPRVEAADLLMQMQRRYLAEVRAERLRRWPSADDSTAEPPACPPFAAGPERWAAFVTSDLPAVFGDDPALDFEPGAEAQADLLARLRSVPLAALRQACAVLSSVPEATTEAAPTPSAVARSAEPATASSGRTTVGRYDDPRDFLRAVMNDPATPLALRIEAAKALLTVTQSAA